MANFIYHLSVSLPLFKYSHICIIWLSVGQIDNLYRRVVHILIAKGESSGQFEENSVAIEGLPRDKLMRSDLDILKRERLKKRGRQ